MNVGGVGGTAGATRRRRLAGAGVSLVLVATALILATEDGNQEVAEAVDTSPHLVGAAELAELEGTLGHELYWAGERPPEVLELTREADGSVYLRYLPPGVAAGDPSPRFLTVGTYPVAAAVAALARTAARSASALERGPGGSRVLANPSSRGSVYFAYPGSDLQVEVYDPTPGQALRLIRSGAIRPLG